MYRSVVGGICFVLVKSAECGVPEEKQVDVRDGIYTKDDIRFRRASIVACGSKSVPTGHRDTKDRRCLQKTKAAAAPRKQYMLVSRGLWQSYVNLGVGTKVCVITQ